MAPQGLTTIGSFTQEKIGTRYVFVAFRTFVDPNTPGDTNQAHALHDAIKVSQIGGPGRLEVPDRDKASQDKVRTTLLALSDTLPDLSKAFGTREEIDPVQHLIGMASAWGGNPDKDSIYLNVTPTRNDAKTIYKLVVPGGVPVDAFWSVIVYDATSHIRKNALNAYSLNSVTATKGPTGSVTVQLGGCDGKAPNCLPTTKDWNYMVRLYRRRAEILSGKWKFPEAQPVL